MRMVVIVLVGIITGCGRGKLDGALGKLECLSRGRWPVDSYGGKLDGRWW